MPPGQTGLLAGRAVRPGAKWPKTVAVYMGAPLTLRHAAPLWPAVPWHTGTAQIPMPSSGRGALNRAPNCLFLTTLGAKRQ